MTECDCNVWMKWNRIVGVETHEHILSELGLDPIRCHMRGSIQIFQELQKIIRSKAN